MNQSHINEQPERQPGASSVPDQQTGQGAGGFASRWDAWLNGNLRKRPKEAPLQVQVYSERRGLAYRFSSGETNRPFHVASVGKIFTAVLVARLAQSGRLCLTDPISQYLPAAVLRDLFVYHDQDYAQQVTIEQLLSHRSGAADYFADPVRSGERFLSLVFSQPDNLWTPEKLLDFCRTSQRAVGRPGQRFHYSDTGYILLGLLIEKVTGLSFGQNLDDTFFKPLGMSDSYLLYQAQIGQITRKVTGKRPIDKIWLHGREISSQRNLSCDWAGGGVISTTDDLLRFSRALWQGQLLDLPTLQRMATGVWPFRSGIYYGLGLMELRLEGFFFLLRGLPRLYGHSGILATQLFYDPARDLHLVMNFGDDRQIANSFRFLIEVETTLEREDRARAKG